MSVPLFAEMAEARQQLISNGVPDDQVERMLQADYPDPPADDFAVWPENWHAVRLFEACASQLDYHATTGQPVRLNYPACDVVINRVFPETSAEQFEQLQVLERVVINYVHQHVHRQSKHQR